MRPAVLCFENGNQRSAMLVRVAHAARCAGLTPILVHDAGHRPRAASAFDDTHVIADWGLPTLCTTFDAVSRQYDIRGLWNHSRLFTRDGLVGATVGALATTVGLPACAAAGLYRANNKFLMRDTLAATGHSTVGHWLVDDATIDAVASDIPYPVILKPICGASSHLLSRPKATTHDQAA